MKIKYESRAKVNVQKAEELAGFDGVFDANDELDAEVMHFTDKNNWLKVIKDYLGANQSDDTEETYKLKQEMLFAINEIESAKSGIKNIADKGAKDGDNYLIDQVEWESCCKKIFASNLSKIVSNYNKATNYKYVMTPEMQCLAGYARGFDAYKYCLENDAVKINTEELNNDKDAVNNDFATLENINSEVTEFVNYLNAENIPSQEDELEKLEVQIEAEKKILKQEIANKKNLDMMIARVQLYRYRAELGMSLCKMDKLAELIDKDVIRIKLPNTTPERAEELAAEIEAYNNYYENEKIKLEETGENFKKFWHELMELGYITNGNNEEQSLNFQMAMHNSKSYEEWKAVYNQSSEFLTGSGALGAEIAQKNIIASQRKKINYLESKKKDIETCVKTVKELKALIGNDDIKSHCQEVSSLSKDLTDKNSLETLIEKYQKMYDRVNHTNLDGHHNDTDEFKNMREHLEAVCNAKDKTELDKNLTELLISANNYLQEKKSGIHLKAFSSPMRYYRIAFAKDLINMANATQDIIANSGTVETAVAEAGAKVAQVNEKQVKYVVMIDSCKGNNYNKEKADVIAAAANKQEKERLVVDKFLATAEKSTARKFVLDACDRKLDEKPVKKVNEKADVNSKDTKPEVKVSEVPVR